MTRLPLLSAPRPQPRRPAPALPPLTCVRRCPGARCPRCQPPGRRLLPRRCPPRGPARSGTERPAGPVQRSAGPGREGRVGGAGPRAGSSLSRGHRTRGAVGAHGALGTERLCPGCGHHLPPPRRARSAGTPPRFPSPLKSPPTLACPPPSRAANPPRPPPPGRAAVMTE